MRTINQTLIADRSGISRAHLNEIVNGKRPMGRNVARAIGEALKLDPATLIFSEGEELIKMLAQGQSHLTQQSCGQGQMAGEQGFEVPSADQAEQPGS